MGLRAFGKNVIIEKDREQEATSFGFVLTRAGPGKDVAFGTLVSVGETVGDPDYAVGRRVAFTDRTVLRNNLPYNPCENLEDGRTLVLTDCTDIRFFVD